MNKHYIRVTDGIVIKGFSDAFEKPLEGDPCISENGGRHFELAGEINPPLLNENGTHIYRYDTKLRKATKEELEAERQKMDCEEPVTAGELALELLADHEYRLCMLELG